MFRGRDPMATLAEAAWQASLALCRRSVLVALLMWGCACASHASDTNDPVAIRRDYQTKAGLLLSFVKFVDWPTNTPGSPDKLCIGILGSGKVPGIVTNELAGKRIGKKVIETINCKTPEDFKRCGMIFITRSKSGRMADLQKVIAGRPVLTVGEFDWFTERGGCINFVRKGERIRLEVNLGAVERAGLKLSSKISSMTVHIRGKEVGE